MVVNNPNLPKIGHYVTLNCSKDKFLQLGYSIKCYNKWNKQYPSYIEDIGPNNNGLLIAEVMFLNEYGIKQGYMLVELNLLKRCKAQTIQFA